ncbi:MAG TPA: hypothetical protein VGS28_03505 [Candidatus Saccharimonadales bacterium]|nr:hypothetical protein [Candidatus Saccharimonadales bacterium]
MQRKPFLQITKQKLRTILGCLWLLDGLLQLQPKMFTSGFANQVLAPAGQGQPSFVHSGVHLAVHAVLMHPALFDACFALIQLALGVLILRKKTMRFGLIGSIIWGLAVWYFGEGLGGLAGGQAMLLTGAPGAALLYSILALGILPSYDRDEHETNRQPSDWLNYVWLAVWAGGAVLLLWASQGASSMVASMIKSMASGTPHWLASVDTHTGNWVAAQGNWLLFASMTVFVAIGLTAVMSRKWKILGVCLGCILSATFWVVGQSLGGYYTGLATDPNSGPLLILLGITILGTNEIRLGLFNSSP